MRVTIFMIGAMICWTISPDMEYPYMLAVPTIVVGLWALAGDIKDFFDL